jgi:hypothetical protein
MQHVEGESYRTFNSLKETITAQLQNNDTPLMQFLISNLNRIIRFAKDAAAKSTIGCNRFGTIGEIPQ